MGILETWAKERTKRIEARNKRKTAAKTARAQSRADVAEATGMRAGQALAGSLGDAGTAYAGGSVTRNNAGIGTRGGAGARSGGGMVGAGKAEDNTLLYVGGAVLMGLLLMGQGQKK
jgi:hypothetical protein